MRGKKKHVDNKKDLYDIHGSKIPQDKWSTDITTFWKQIYQMHDNKIQETWNPTEREIYTKYYNDVQAVADYRNNRTFIPYILHEHYDMQAKVSYKGYMDEPYITEEDVMQQMKKIKDRKSPGPDDIKADLLKILGSDPHCTKVLASSMNRIIEKKDNIQDTWSISKTVLVPKKKKPTIKDLRPIALTNATYKLVMGILKTKIEHHVRYIKQENEVQAGFTKNRRIADNLYILDFCIKESY